MRFSDRLASLGFATYEAYLASAHWHSVKAKWCASGRPSLCAVCGANPIQLHHHTYDRLGRERLDDLTPLCRTHHIEVHAVLSAKGWRVCKTSSAINIIRNDLGLPRAHPKKTKPTKKDRRRKSGAKGKHRKPAQQIGPGQYKKFFRQQRQEKFLEEYKKDWI